MTNFGQPYIVVEDGDFNGPASLEEQVYAPKRQRTAELVKQTVDALLAERSRVSLTSSSPAPVRVKPDRDVARVHQRYMRLRKQELTDRLLAVEQAYAEQEERWLRLNDEGRAG
ncbi:MAG: hypothetical protein ACOY94_06290 [Bacillota bacterium]